MFSRLVGFVTILLLLFNPLFWFYGEIAEIYMAEAGLCTLIAYLSYQLIRQNSDRNFYMLAAVFGFSGGFRQDILCFMFPLCLYSTLTYTKSLRKLLISACIFSLSILIWYIPMIILSEGYNAYSEKSRFLFESVQQNSILFGAPLKSHIKMLVEFLRFSIVGAFFAFVFSFIYLLVSRKSASFFIPSLKDRRVIFLLLWVLPSLFFYLSIYVAKAGYTLTYLPAVHIILGYAVIVLSRYLSALIFRSFKTCLSILLIVIITSNSLYFLFATPFDTRRFPYLTKRYHKKNFHQNLMTQLDMLLNYTLSAIRREDDLMRSFIQSVKSLPYHSDRTPVVVFADGLICWRRAMYYLPNHNVYFLKNDISSNNITNVKIGYKHSHSNLDPLKVISFGSKADCVIWIVNPWTSLYLPLQDQLPLRSFSGLPPGFYVSEPPDKMVNLGGIKLLP